VVTEPPVAVMVAEAPMMVAVPVESIATMSLKPTVEAPAVTVMATVPVESPPTMPLKSTVGAAAAPPVKAVAPPGPPASLGLADRGPAEEEGDHHRKGPKIGHHAYSTQTRGWLFTREASLLSCSDCTLAGGRHGRRLGPEPGDDRRPFTTVDDLGERADDAEDDRAGGRAEHALFGSRWKHLPR
jgi:hypothetical protein